MSDEPALSRRKFDLIVRSEITIERAIREVWPHFLDTGAWMSGLSFERIAGRRGEEGEVRLVTPAGATPYDAYFITVVRATPLRQFVYKVTPRQGTDYLGFADFSFNEMDGKTHLVYDIYLELAVPEMSAEAFQRFADQQYSIARRDVAVNNLNLKSLVEGLREP